MAQENHYNKKVLKKCDLPAWFFSNFENPIGAVIFSCSGDTVLQLPGKVTLFLCLSFMAANWQEDKLLVAQGRVVMMS